ncbi:MAG: glutamine synthetase III [Oscillospiraceae bacterium]|nr:glutamine synthetase III [Oscillospiraceae bacterium]
MFIILKGVLSVDLLKDFGSRVFSDDIMMKHLPSEIYNSLKKSIELSLPLEPEIASIIAAAMKDWAIENGATHYTHWFQPMTGITAGKHDSFISLKSGEIEFEFSGKELIKGEPDASSFPHGGLRNTFEARGYTVWDCTSPAFIKGKTLYIPTAFCSYNGEALDTKTPLLRSMEVISEQAIRILRAFGDENTTQVIPTVGAEQEYFLIDRQNYEKRLDLKICGRTMFGTNPPKGQEMDDHYCSRIRIRISDYMYELDKELWKFGIGSKTRHNEVAPAQHEMAPMFESCNVASDHNQLTMETMRTVAKEKQLACLLHEKPFAYVNGSGKHNNWSLSTANGKNLLDIGKTKKENLQFLVFLCAVIRGVDIHAGLLHLTAASAGNDNRLGAQEAPPSIISIFLGKHLTDILNNIACGKSISDENDTDVLVTNVHTLPNLPKDDSDRNRTSPFAFTGNKFEFRMLGSSASISLSTTVINLIVAESLEYFANVIENSDNFDKAIIDIIEETMKKHGRIIFNGNGYTASWQEEAKKRGLSNLKNTVEAAGEFINEKSVKLFEHFNVLSRCECQARYEIMLGIYCKTLSIEANTMLEMVNRQILPAVIRYADEISKTYIYMDKCGVRNDCLKDTLKSLSTSINDITNAKDLLKASVEIKDFNNKLEKAQHYCNSVLNLMNSLRESVDKVEHIIPKDKWPMPSITDLLYRV